MDILSLFGNIGKAIIGIADDSYNKGYLYYLLIGMILLFLLIILFNRHLLT